MAHFSFDRSRFVSLLKELCTHINKKSEFVSFRYAQISKSGDSIYLSSYSTEIMMRSLLCSGVEELEDGQWYFPAREVLDIVSSAKSDYVDLIFEDMLKIHLGDDRFSLVLDDNVSHDWPDLGDAEEVCSIDSIKLLDLMSVDFCCSSESGRYITNAVFLKGEKGVDLTSIAVDGKRLAKKFYPYGGNNFQALLPSDGIPTLKKCLSSYEGEVSISSLGNRIILDIGEEKKIVLSMFDFRSFPKIDGIPYHKEEYISSCSLVIMERKKFLDALKRLCVVLSSDDKMAKSMRKADLFVSKSDVELGYSGMSSEASITVDVIDSDIEGDIKGIGFNPFLLSSIVSNISTEELSLYVKGVSDPLVFKTVNGVYLLMTFS